VKKYITIIFIFLSLFPLSAENKSITITNSELSPFYFVVDPEELADINPAGPVPIYGLISKFFGSTDRSIVFSRIDPGETQTIRNLYPGDHLIVGFFKKENALRYPAGVFGITVRYGTSGVNYILHEKPVLLTVSSNRGILKNYFISRENEFPVAASAEAMAAASFTAGSKPSYFTLNYRGTDRVHAISDSGFWGKGGTNLHFFRILAVKRGIIPLRLESYTGFLDNVSYFLYFYTVRNTKETNRYTIEIKPLFKGSPKGFIVLWRKGIKNPDIIGFTRTNGLNMYGEIDIKKIPAGLFDFPSKTLSFDLTSCYFDEEEGTYEEFFLASIRLTN